MKDNLDTHRLIKYALEMKAKEEAGCRMVNVDKVVEEIKKLDLDGVSMVEDGKYKLVRKNEVVSLVQNNGICNGRYDTCAKCTKLGCPLTTDETLSDRWSKEVRKGGVE